MTVMRANPSKLDVPVSDTQGRTIGGIQFSSYTTVMQRLKEALTATDANGNVLSTLIGPNATDSPWKATETLMATARALDLYLALENALIYYEQEFPSMPSFHSYLIGQSQYEALSLELAGMADSIVVKTTDPAVLLTGIGEHEVQAGNWPMISFVGVGYSLLAVRLTPTYYSSDNNLGRWGRLASHREKADDAVLFASSGYKRNHYWSYQTGGGKRFFAEHAYYLHWTLRAVLPYLHATRANGLHHITDPISHPAFVNPLVDLASTVMPGGNTVPLDDGNKVHLTSAHLLAWGPSYGPTALGGKFSSVSQELGVGTVEALQLPLVVAIPRAGIFTQPLDALVDNSDGEDMALVARFRQGQMGCGANSSSDCHYVLVNGERGESHVNGEGHEQPDQLQLLYSVGSADYITDTGYDEAPNTSNSTWNSWRYHNNVRVYDFDPAQTKYQHLSGFQIPDGDMPSYLSGNHPLSENILRGRFRPVGGWNTVGLPSPNVSLGDKRMVIGSSDASINAQSINDKVIVMEGQVDVANDDFRRTTLSILGQDGALPYLVDMTTTSSRQNTNQRYAAVYHVNSTDQAFDEAQYSKPFGYYAWNNIGDDSNRSLWMHSTRVEGQGYDGFYNDVRVGVTDSKVSRLKDIHRYEVWSRNPIDERYLTDDTCNPSGQKSFHTTVTLIRALVGPIGPTPVDGVKQTPRLESGRSGNCPFLHESLIYPVDGKSYTDTQVMDLVVKRSARVYYSSPQSRATINGTTGQIGLSYVLPAQHDFGFARLRKVGDSWQVDPVYTVNLQLPEKVTANVTTTSGQTLDGQLSGVNVFRSGASLNVTPGKTLTISGSVTFENYGRLNVPSSSRLVVEPGSELVFDGGTGLWSSGKVEMLGTAGPGSITIRKLGSRQYNYIYLNGSGTNNSVFNHVDISGSKYGVHTNGTVGVSFSNINGHHNHAHTLKLYNGTGWVQNSTFEHNTYGGAFLQGGVFTLSNNEFQNNHYYGLSVGRGAIASVFSAHVGTDPSRYAGNGMKGINVYYDSDFYMSGEFGVPGFAATFSGGGGTVSGNGGGTLYSGDNRAQIEVKGESPTYSLTSSGGALLPDRRWLTALERVQQISRYSPYRVITRRVLWRSAI